MNYYYDLILNFSKDYIPFYEWNIEDGLECVEKIPLYKINENDMLVILQNNIKVNNEFLNLIKDKTLLKKGGLINAIEYAVILTDTKSCVALEFDKEGTLINRSNLMLEDDLNVIEMAFVLKNKTIKYEVLNELEICDQLREIIKIKNSIKHELQKLCKENDTLKLSFLYLEWFGQKESNIKTMYTKMLKELEKELDDNQSKIYEIIKLSYSKI